MALTKNRIDTGVKYSIPLTSRFQITKWERPASEEIRKHIKWKKSLWRKYIRDINTTNWFKYTYYNEIKLRKLSGMTPKNSRMQLLNSIKQTRKFLEIRQL